MRTCFLTSSPADAGEKLNPANGFVRELRAALPQSCRALFVCSDPDSPDKTDFFARQLRRSLEEAGFRFANFAVLDRRNQRDAARELGGADFVILGGGHVPTQNRFFTQIGLRGLMEPFGGTVLGISAGSMNSADVVYAQPELPGEALDPHYRKFLRGLGLAKTMLLPHYQLTKNETLDGMRLFDEITSRDSLGRCFYAIPDGSYLLVRDGGEELRGEAYRIENGVLRQILSDGQTLRL